MRLRLRFIALLALALCARALALSAVEPTVDIHTFQDNLCVTANPSGASNAALCQAAGAAPTDSNVSSHNCIPMLTSYARVGGIVVVCDNSTFGAQEAYATYFSDPCCAPTSFISTQYRQEGRSCGMGEFRTGLKYECVWPGAAPAPASAACDASLTWSCTAAIDVVVWVLVYVATFAGLLLVYRLLRWAALQAALLLCALDAAQTAKISGLLHE